LAPRCQNLKLVPTYNYTQQIFFIDILLKSDTKKFIQKILQSIFRLALNEIESAELLQIGDGIALFWMNLHHFGLAMNFHPYFP